MSDWRRRLYDKYVSSGQGGLGSSNDYKSEGPFINYVIKNHIPADRNIRILDLGCGSGGAIFWLKKAGYLNISGVDFSDEMVNIAINAGLKEVKLGDLQSELKEISDNSLDVVIIFDVLEHLTREILFEVCDGIFRVLKPGGRVIAHVPNAEGVFGSRIRYGDLTHELAFTPSSIRQLFQTTGFREVKCYEDRPIPHGFKSAMRALVWKMGTFIFRVLHAAETGVYSCILSQNMLTTATVPI